MIKSKLTDFISDANLTTAQRNFLVFKLSDIKYRGALMFAFSKMSLDEVDFISVMNYKDYDNFISLLYVIQSKTLDNRTYKGFNAAIDQQIEYINRTVGGW